MVDALHRTDRTQRETDRDFNDLAPTAGAVTAAVAAALALVS